MTHIKGTPKTLRDTLPKPSRDPIYYDDLARRATVHFVISQRDGDLYLVRYNDQGHAVDKLKSGFSFRHVHVHILPDQGAIVMVEANPGHMDWRIIGTMNQAELDEVCFQQANNPLTGIRVFTSHIAQPWQLTEPMW